MVILHLLLALFATLVTWFLSGILIDATDRVAKRYNKPGFFVAFFVLGFLTSVSEMSVLVNATIEGVPQVSAGNLIGASFVIFLLIIPILAVAGNGIETHASLRKNNLLLLVCVVLSPSLFVLDGSLSGNEGLLILLLYATLLYTVRKSAPSEEIATEAMRDVEQELLHKHHATLVDIAKVTIGAVLIFIAGKILVDEAIYFSELLLVPPSFIGLMVLSIGTNVPELTIALRCVVGKHKHIAFGDYMGSAAANSALFGVLALLNGDFPLERSEFIPIFLLFLPGLVLFFLFSRSKSVLSRREGIVLLLLYAAFLIVEGITIITIAPLVHGSV